MAADPPPPRARVGSSPATDNGGPAGAGEGLLVRNGPGALGAAPAGQVWARRAPNEPLRRLNFHERVSTSLWFVPALFVAGSFVLSKATVAIDRALNAHTAPSWLVGGSADAAAALTSTVAAAMLTFLGVVFATTLVAIQLAGGQYSPRIVR